MDTLLLTKSDINGLLTMKETIEAVKDAFKDFNSGNVLQPDVISLEVPNYHGEMDIKSGYSKSTDVIAVKNALGYRKNEALYNLPSLMATMTLFDAKTGFPLCFMDASLITNYRTGASGAVAASLFANPSLDSVAIIGTGNQGVMQVIALKELFALKTVYLWGRSGERTSAYKSKLEKELGIAVEICMDVEMAVKNTELIVTATPSKVPLVKKEWVNKGTHINAIGADMSGKNELDPKLFADSTIINDSINQCVSRGETRNAILAKCISQNDIYAEIGEVLLGEKEVIRSHDNISIFDSTGMSIQDNTTAFMLYKKALSKNVGTKINLI